MQAAVFDFKQDFFQLLNMSASYRLDNAALEQHYRTLQSQVHPDKFAHLSEAEQRVSMQYSTRVNEAFQTLRNPIKRARYLLALRGVDTQEETNTSMPVEFLMQQMEWREAIEEAQQAKDGSALEELEMRFQHEMHALQKQLAVKIDDEHDYPVAAGLVRKLRFMEKLAEEIISAFEMIDN